MKKLIVVVLLALIALTSCEMTPEFIIYDVDFTQQFSGSSYELPESDFLGLSPEGEEWADGSENWSNFYYAIIFYDMNESWDQGEEVYPRILSSFMSTRTQTLFQMVVPFDLKRDFHILVIVWDNIDRIGAPSISEPHDYFLLRGFWEPDDHVELVEGSYTPANFHMGDMFNDYPGGSSLHPLKELLGRE